MLRSIALSGATRSLAAVALWAVLTDTANAQLVNRANLGDITVENEGDRPESTHGYRNNLFRITNRAAVPHRVRLTAPYGRPSRMELRSISAEVEVPGGESRDVYLWQPALDMQGHGVQVAIDGKPERNSLSVHFPGQAYRQASILCLLFGRDVDGQLPGQANRHGPQGQPFRGDIRVTRLFLEPTRWSRYWLSYSAFDGVALTGKELSTLPSDVRQAVFRYVECGGALTVLGAWEAPAHWKRPGFVEQIALPVVFPAKPDFRPPPPKGETWRYSVGFGECLVMTEPNFRIWHDDQRGPLVGSWARTSAPFARNRHAGEVNQRFEIVKNVEVPVRGLFLLMIGFVIVIGPLNLLWLSRIRRRLWLLWTVPAISGLTCVCVLGYMLLSEGTTTHTRTEALTILDETTGRATTIGWSGIYAPIPPGGLDFDDQTELTGLWSPSGRTTVNRTIDWSHGQHLNAAWVPARLPVHFQMRKSEARTERVRIDKANDGRWWLSNGLPAPLRFIYVADREGKILTARDVPRGGKASLQPFDDKEAKDQAPGEGQLARRTLREVFSGGDWPSAIAEMRQAPESVLLPGCYLAAMDESPFLPDGVAGPAERKQSAVVYGIMKEPFDAR